MRDSPRSRLPPAGVEPGARVAFDRADDDQYMVPLIGQVIAVSLENLRICKALLEIDFEGGPIDSR